MSRHCKKTPAVFIALLGALTLLASCSRFSHPADTKQLPTQDSHVETELERNRRIWRERNIADYRMTLQSSIADALYSTLSPVEIEVRQNKAVSIKHLGTDASPIPMEELNHKPGLLLYHRRGLDTVDGLFTFIEKAEEGKNVKIPKTLRLEVEYDPNLGYPTKIEHLLAATDASTFLRVIKVEIIN